MVYIYALKCQQNKYYVGKTTNPNIRLESHSNANGSAWTKKYKPIRVMELIKYFEDTTGLINRKKLQVLDGKNN